MTEIGSLFQTTIDSYPHDRAAGAEACEQLLSIPGLPADMEMAVRRNQTWYLEPIAATGSAAFREPPYVTSREVTLPVVPAGWSRFNPSIAADPDGHLSMLVRSSNYTVDGEMRYTISDRNQVIRTTNYVVRTVDPKSLGVGDWLPIWDESRERWPIFPVVGYEDARLFWHDGWKFSATVRDRHPSGVCQMVMVTLDDWDVVDEVVLSGRRRHEKNWMPVVRDLLPYGNNDARWVYSCSPFLVVNHRGTVHQGSLASPYGAREFRGGTQVIPLDDGQHGLAIVHESVDLPGSIPARVYQHRFILIDHDVGTLVRISEPFCFHGRGLEFAAGMVLVDDHLIISYGRDDASAWLFKLPLERALGMLRKPESEDL